MADKHSQHEYHLNNGESVVLHCYESIEAIGRERWSAHFVEDSPFVDYAFLASLERSGCVSIGTGWLPRHLLLEARCCGDSWLLPGYAKTHSWGEYVFDFEWAKAYQFHGCDYYPKWVCCIPFTPSPGARIGNKLTNKQHAVTLPSQVISKWANEQGYSSWHILMTADSQYYSQLADKHLQRIGVQYHWFNQNYRDFEDYLAAMSRKARKKVRQERRRVGNQGIACRWLQGQAAGEFLRHEFYRFYVQTYLKRSGHNGYLNAAFFQQIADAMSDQVAICIAETSRRGQKCVIAAALFFFDHDKLYGRYWGALEEADCLHFELCYYQGIEFAIAHQLKVFDAGAQGEHKISRGFEPVFTQSFCEIIEPGFREAIRSYCEEESQWQRSWEAKARSRLPW